MSSSQEFSEMSQDTQMCDKSKQEQEECHFYEMMFTSSVAERALLRRQKQQQQQENEEKYENEHIKLHKDALENEYKQRVAVVDTEHGKGLISQSVFQFGKPICLYGGIEVDCSNWSGDDERRTRLIYFKGSKRGKGLYADKNNTNSFGHYSNHEKKDKANARLKRLHRFPGDFEVVLIAQRKIEPGEEIRIFYSDDTKRSELVEEDLFVKGR